MCVFYFFILHLRRQGNWLTSRHTLVSFEARGESREKSQQEYLPQYLPYAYKKQGKNVESTRLETDPHLSSSKIVHQINKEHYVQSTCFQHKKSKSIRSGPPAKLICIAGPTVFLYTIEVIAKGLNLEKEWQDRAHFLSPSVDG